MTAPSSYNANVVLSADVAQYQQGMAAAAQSTNQATGAINKLGQAYTSAKQKTKDKLVNYDRASVATLAAATAAAALYQKQLSQLSASAAVTGQSMGKLKNSIDSTFEKVPVSRGDLVQLATTINTLGVTGSKDIGTLTNTFTKLAAATGGSAQSLAGSMLAFTNAMGDMSTGNVKAMSNSLVDLAKNEGLAAQNILNFAQAIAPIARVSGVTENQVLGLATAFNKAGADGYVAANTFNSILENITALSSTGSPELAKYADVLGLTVQQFNNLPKAQAVADLFETINRQGSAGITTLNNLGINGVRSISALQAVVSQGGLAQLANGGSTTNGALDKASNAAFNNLADNLAVTRNQLTQYGTAIGNTFVGPLNSAVKVVNALVRELGFLKPLLAIPIAAAGVIGSGIAPLVSVAAPLVAARWLMRGPVGGGARTGFMMGRYGQDSAAGAEYRRRMEARGYKMDTNPESENYMGNTRRMFFNLGARTGALFDRNIPTTDTALGATMAGLRNRIVSSPLRLISGVANTQTQWYRNTYQNQGEGRWYQGWTGRPGSFDTPRTDAILGRIGGLGRGMSFSNFRDTATSRFQSLRSFYQANPGANQFITESVKSIGARVRSGDLSTDSEEFKGALRSLTTQAREHLASITKQLEAEGRSTTMNKELATQVGVVTRAMAELGGATIKASVSSLGATARALPGSSLARGAIGGAGRFAGNLAKDFVGSPLGAIMIGGSLAYEGYSQFKDNAASKADWHDYLNPIQKYNEQLGIATTNLANFSQGLQKSTDASQQSAPTSLAAAARVTSTDVATAGNKPVNNMYGTLTGLSGNQLYSTGASLIGTLPITDPRQLQAVKEDLLATGISQYDTGQILKTYMNQGGPSSVTGTLGQTNFGKLAGQVVGTEGKGTNLEIGDLGQQARTLVTDPVAFFTGSSKSEDASQSDAGKKIVASTLSGIQSAFQANSTTYGGGYASLERLSNVGQFFGAMLPTASSDNSSFKGAATREALARGLSKLTGGGYGDYLDALRNGDKKFTGGQGIIDLLRVTDKGRQFLNATSEASGTNVRSKGFYDNIQNAIVNQQNAGGSDFNTLISSGTGQAGVLGRYAAQDDNVQQAIGVKQGDPGTVHEATRYLAAQSLITSGSSNTIGTLLKAQKNLQALADKTGDLTSPFSQLALAAKGLITKMEQVQLPTLSRNLQLGVAITSYQDAAHAARGTDYEKNLGAAQDNFNAAKEQYRQYLLSTYQTLKSYTTQMNDTYEDYYKQRGRQIQAFNLQEKYGQEDYQKSINRSKRDYSISLSNQAIQTSQNIYNPYARRQAQYVADSGTLIQNLNDQNGAIQKQKQELDALKKMGLSKEAIQVLDLANPNNSQQLDRLYLDAKADPSTLIQYNAATAKRIKLTRDLTQNDFNLSFQQTNEDFTRGLKDASQDYKTSQERAVAAQHLALNQMSQDFTVMVNRSARDLQTSMTEITGDFGTMFGNAMSMANGQVAKYAPGAAKIILTQLNGLKAAYPMLFDPNWDPQIGAITMPGGQSVHDAVNNLGTPNKAPAPASSSPGGNGMVVVGVNPSTGAVIWGKPPGHAMGGISTYAHMANISEGGKHEAIIPLDSRGQSFMTGMYNAVAKSVLQQSKSAQFYGGSTTKTFVDNSTNISGVTVQVADTKQFVKDMQSKARLTRLSKPASASVTS